MKSFCSASDSHHAHKFLAAVQDCLLFQHVTQPTRFRDGVTPSTLDLVMTNEEGMLTDLQYSPGLGMSDHVLLSFKLACYTVQSVCTDKRLNFHRADFDKLNEKIYETDWDKLKTSPVEDGYSMFKDKLDCIVASCIPEAKSSQSRRNIYMTSGALHLRKKKNSLWQKSMVTNDPVDIVRLRRSRNKLRQLTRQLRKSFEAQLVAEIKGNQKAFWKYSNSRLKTKPRIASLKDASGLLVSKGVEKAAIQASSPAKSRVRYPLPLAKF